MAPTASSYNPCAHISVPGRNRSPQAFRIGTFLKSADPTTTQSSLRTRNQKVWYAYVMRLILLGYRTAPFHNFQENTFHRLSIADNTEFRLSSAISVTQSLRLIRCQRNQLKPFCLYHQFPFPPSCISSVSYLSIHHTINTKNCEKTPSSISPQPDILLLFCLKSPVIEFLRRARLLQQPNLPQHEVRLLPEEHVTGTLFIAQKSPPLNLRQAVSSQPAGTFYFEASGSGSLSHKEDLPVNIGVRQSR